MRSEVKKVFDQFILETFKGKTDLQRFFLKHERYDVCLDNLCEQIQIIEKRAYKILFDVEEYRKTIRSIAKFFCETTLAHANQNQMSSLERDRLERELNKDKHNDDLIREMVKDGLIRDNDENQYKLGADDGPSEDEASV